MSTEFLQAEGIHSILYAYGAGFLTSLTPCVYPLIPITLAVVGAKRNVARSKAFALSSCYVLGLAMTYTVLGMVSAKTGALFGSFLAKPYIIIPLAVFFTLLGLYTLELIRMPSISKLQARAGNMGGGGFTGAFIMGTVSGLVAAPCVGPSLIAILAVAAHSQSASWSAGLLFAYSLGLGTLFLVLGTYSSLLDRLPKSGNWLCWIKFALSVAIFVLVLFLLQPLLALPKATMSTTLVIALIAIALASYSIGRQKKVPTLSASLLLAVVFFQQAVTIDMSSQTRIAWHADPTTAIAEARDDDKLVMIDFYADWCAACKEYETKTFANEQVSHELTKLVTAKVDLTEMSDENEAVQEKFQVVGLPAIVFLAPDGKEIPKTRLNGFKDSDSFLKHLRRVHKKAKLLSLVAFNR